MAEPKRPVLPGDDMGCERVVERVQIDACAFKHFLRRRADRGRGGKRVSRRDGQRIDPGAHERLERHRHR